MHRADRPPRRADEPEDALGDAGVDAADPADRAAELLQPEPRQRAGLALRALLGGDELLAHAATCSRSSTRAKRSPAPGSLRSMSAVLGLLTSRASPMSSMPRMIA